MPNTSKKDLKFSEKDLTFPEKDLMFIENTNESAHRVYFISIQCLKKIKIVYLQFNHLNK